MPMPSYRSHPTNERLPENFRPLFWPYWFDDLDPEKHKQTVVVHLVNYGTLEHWRWLVRRYGVRDIRRILRSVPATEINPRTRALASLLFSISHWERAPRSAH